MKTKATKSYDMPVCNIETGQTFFNVIEERFTSDTIPWKKLIGYATDRASVMVGRHNSVLSRLKQVQPNIYRFHVFAIAFIMFVSIL